MLISLRGLTVAVLLSAVACQLSLPHFHHHTGLEHGSQCATIEVASDISFSKERSSALQLIAANRNLSLHEQHFLIDTVVSGGGFSSDVADVFVVLALNSAMTVDSRLYLSERLHEMTLASNDLERIAAALASR